MPVLPGTSTSSRRCSGVVVSSPVSWAKHAVPASEANASNARLSFIVSIDNSSSSRRKAVAHAEAVPDVDRADHKGEIDALLIVECLAHLRVVFVGGAGVSHTRECLGPG